ncbi:hypothetical protein K505DRAFT_327021 [Melanomma pulvis-pyrius CBS 109.77]|uniref:Uncharacterized protein n=1 Tax=Melanomma pulvis-pyrius CBS 109.77 TaxID=1314802 RepID=A0A6A6X4Z1_9PLEO|nr:hypothetical protein K505DRAFT_327021 [Melanomma pulvis-pyrius CBS 109.77]
MTALSSTSRLVAPSLPSPSSITRSTPFMRPETLRKSPTGNSSTRKQPSPDPPSWGLGSQVSKPPGI